MAVYWQQACNHIPQEEEKKYPTLQHFCNSHLKSPTKHAGTSALKMKSDYRFRKQYYEKKKKKITQVIQTT